MKTVTIYECDICGHRYEKLCDAQDCEMRGVPQEYPIGCVYGNNDPGAFYHGIVFAVASNNVDGHYNHTSAWACRDHPPVGDTLGDEHCQGESKLSPWHAHVRRTIPAFGRMLEWLRSQGIEPTIWDGEKPVPLREEVKV